MHKSRNALPKFLLIGHILFGAVHGHGHGLEPSCVPLFRTLGVEWEFSAVRYQMDSMGQNPLKSLLSGNTPKLLELGSSNLRRLYGFYGKNQKGAWVANLIPTEVLAGPKFSDALQKFGLSVEVRDGNSYLKGLDQLDALTYLNAMKAIMQSRERDGSTLKMRKIPEAWREHQNMYDKLTPEEMAEEWRGDTFTNVEFPMKGGVEKAAHLRGYVRNLWIRLGLFEASDSRLEAALDLAQGHVHWVADIQALPRDQRLRVYRSVINFWADAKYPLTDARLAEE